MRRVIDPREKPLYWIHRFQSTGLHSDADNGYSAAARGWSAEKGAAMSILRGMRYRNVGFECLQIETDANADC